ncbi:MAG: hypothetical protein NMK33_00380 [Candidatus Cardinium sp.]|uniref:hypothetical protein n=1 Tax=Cardinium endosymbiont of Dermatophagoides farinae TaxID=2597823 RepID=UPI0011949475|nr:hypothetical protein [Cardinium endosymbiont of Dermatophagoides farinae]TSJ80988.1 hypothetical protein FPG78_03060 [Cardinium endosymbiont of Dermatophagoides farinae]UWW97014.1 MAG: hypothetical protein NMK33_00380 [Candidatus Cardinium sp.]
MNLLIIHELNKSICKGETDKDTAQKQYSKACKLITEMYNSISINNSYESELTKLLNKKASSKLLDYGDTELIRKLSKAYFKSIGDKINKIKEIIHSITYYSDPILKDEITKIFKVCYSTVSIYVIIGLLLDFSTLTLLCNPELTGYNKEVIYAIQYARKTLATSALYNTS